MTLGQDGRKISPDFKSWGTGVNRKIAVIAAVAACVAVPALSGSLADPVLDPSVIIEDTVQSSGQLEGMLAAVAIITIILGAAGAF